jgi:hypothetical protein
MKAGYPDEAALYAAFVENKAQLPEAFTAALRNAELAKKIDLAFRTRLLYQRFKLDAKLIHEINQHFGKLDWRLPEAQAIYWARMGLRKTPGGKDINCERIASQSLYEAFRSGRLMLADTKDFSTAQMAPNLDLADSVKRTFEEVRSTVFYIIRNHDLFFRRNIFTGVEFIRRLQPTDPQFVFHEVVGAIQFRHFIFADDVHVFAADKERTGFGRFHGFEFLHQIRRNVFHSIQCTNVNFIGRIGLVGFYSKFFAGHLPNVIGKFFRRKMTAGIRIFSQHDFRCLISFDQIKGGHRRD